MRLVLSGHKVSRSLVKVTMIGSSHVYSPDGLKTNHYLKAVSLRQPLGEEKSGRTHIPIKEEVVRSL